MPSAPCCGTLLAGSSACGSIPSKEPFRHPPPPDLLATSRSYVQLLPTLFLSHKNQESLDVEWFYHRQEAYWVSKIILDSDNDLRIPFLRMKERGFVTRAGSPCPLDIPICYIFDTHVPTFVVVNRDLSRWAAIRLDCDGQWAFSL